MAETLDQIDPAGAWSAYEPDARQPWDLRRAAHLLRRAGFGADRQQLEQALRQGPAETVASLFVDKTDDLFRRESRDLATSFLATGDAKNLSVWWLHRMLNTPQPLREKMTLFWHGHFATSAAKVQDAQVMFTQNELLRQHALGDFAQLVLGISRDPAMLIYLDSATNRKAHPNENYAREVMELFCLGEGHYSERDVQELARCFTGWEVRRKQFRFNRVQHDEGEKTILGRTARFSGEEAVAQVLAQPAAPQFIVGKLFRYFFCDEPTPPQELLAPLADQFRAEGLQVGGVLRRMFASRLFYSPQVIAARIRSPVELSVGLLRTLQGSTNLTVLARETAELGQEVFFPPSVKGWDGGRAWVNSATLLGRANLVRRLLDDETTRFAGQSLRELARRSGVAAPAPFVDWLGELLLAAPLPTPVRDQLVATAGSGDADRTYNNLLFALATLPLFQLC